jgi:predicted nucleic-acid-binding Zn-ribbon protein
LTFFARRLRALTGAERRQAEAVLIFIHRARLSPRESWPLAVCWFQAFCIREKTICSPFLAWTAFWLGLCSFEHETHITSPLVAYIAQDNRKTSADGIELMDSAFKTLKEALEAIRDVTANALNQIAQVQEEHSTRWKCKQCQYTKHFTKPVSLEAAGRCPRCKSTEFRPML